MNLMIKREQLLLENKRLFEKSKKVNSIVESLIAQGADKSEIDDVKSMMNEDEMKTFRKATDHCDK
jgi:hypothetical protein